MSKTLILIFLVGCSFFTKASELDSLLNWSAKNHPKLKAAFKSYEASLEQMHGAGYLPDPILTFGYFISSPETRVGPQRGSVGIEQMFPWRGTLKAKNSISVAKSKMKFEIRQGIVQEVSPTLKKHSAREKSSPLQVSGAVTRLTVHRAAPHNTPPRT